jgi:hypothetical protein
MDTGGRGGRVVRYLLTCAFTVVDGHDECELDANGHYYGIAWRTGEINIGTSFGGMLMFL